MPTNDERRKIAAELRENRDPLTPYNLVDYIFDDPWNHDSGEEVAARLADLIEPEERTCRIYDTDHGFEDSIRCDSCQMTFNRPWQPFKFCPDCGARVVKEES